MLHLGKETLSSRYLLPVLIFYFICNDGNTSYGKFSKIYLTGTNLGISVVLLCGETRVPRENPPVSPADHVWSEVPGIETEPTTF